MAGSDEAVSGAMRHDTREYRLIATRLGGQDADDLSSPRRDWDWDRTVQIAAREEVLPALHGKLPAPPEVCDFFDAVHELNAERNRQLLQEVEMLASLLNGAGIQPILLKGSAYLVGGIYSDSADRWLRDIDLLVCSSRSAEAYEMLRNAGYEPHDPKPTSFGRHHHPMLTQIHRVPVEVHHSLGLGACGSFLTAEEMVSASTPFRLGTATVRIPSPEHLMTHQIMHSQMQHGAYHRIWPSLRAMYDLVLIGRRFPQALEAVRSRFRSRGKATLLHLHLKQIEHTMGAPVPLSIPNLGIRWRYRQALWKEPRLRYLDPRYLISRVFLDKFQVARQLFKDPAGRKFVLSTLFRADFYKQLFNDLTNG